jgi:hypothetical protein
MSRSDNSFEELTDVFHREIHGGVADVEFEALQVRSLGVVRSAEHPDPVSRF